MQEFLALSSLSLTVGFSAARAQDPALQASLQAMSRAAGQRAQAVAGGGVTRIIVGPSGGLDGPQSTTLSDIQQNRALRDGFVAGFAAGDATRPARAGLKRLSGLPMVAMNVNEADLRALAADNHVDTIWVDEVSPAGLA